MANAYLNICDQLKQTPRTWLVTGVAGFIGSNLLEALLKLDQYVVGLDNFETGHQHNLDAVKKSVKKHQWERFQFSQGDIRDSEACKTAMFFNGDNGQEAVNYVLHQAALGSVPRSIEDPVRTNSTNIVGFLNILNAAREAGVEKFVYAASSSTYGDHAALPKVEDRIGKPLSPYAVTKVVNEMYADVFAKTYGMTCIGLRYFNIFGKRQDPNGAYAAVIPKWVVDMMNGAPVFINGDGETSRDFCYIDNAVQANILAAFSPQAKESNEIYNIAYGQRITLNDLFESIKSTLEKNQYRLESFKPVYKDFRPGDVRHSLADISKAAKNIGYAPTHSVREGLEEAIAWYLWNAKNNST